jgi:DNA-binding MarR family transcriptional regulator
MTATPKRRPPGSEAWSLMSELVRQTRPRFLGAAAELGLTTPQMMSLLALEPGRPVPMRDLARHLHCDSSNVTGLVDRLAEQGLVERREAEHDRRVRMLALTDRGGDVREEVRGRLAEVPPAIQRLSAADQRALRDILRRALHPGDDGA